MALVCDRMGDDVKKAQSKADCPKNSRIAWNLFYASDDMMHLNSCISWDEIKTNMSPEEISAVDELFNKIILFPNGSVVNYDDASYGSFEGMAIYMRQLPHSLLNKEVDIVNHDDGIIDNSSGIDVDNADSINTSAGQNAPSTTVMKHKSRKIMV